MREELELTPQEAALVAQESEDEQAEREAAFRDFLVLRGTISGRDETHHNFYPNSMDDFRFIDPWGRIGALELCLKTARSERFTPERLERLDALIDYVNRIEPNDYFCLRAIVRLHVYGYHKEQLAHSLSDCIDMIGPMKSENNEQLLLELCETITSERRCHVGYLRLAKQLIDLGSDGVPEEIIPRQAFFMGYPPEGTDVIAWGRGCDDDQTSWFGTIPDGHHIDLYEVAVYPPRRFPDFIRKLGIDAVPGPAWFYNVVPASIVEFYLERPDLYAQHRAVLRMPNIGYIGELIERW